MIEFWATVDAYSLRAYIPADVPILLPASSWAGKGKGRRLPVPTLPPNTRHKAADCGGFVATFRWGGYRYTPDQYVDWLSGWGPDWAAIMDFCCEDEITAGRPGLVRERQDRTTEMVDHFYRQYPDAPWIWVPTVQGWDVDAYVYHARQLRPYVDALAARYGEGGGFRVGIGTLCRRASGAQIRAIVRAVAGELPGVRFHLWGIKLGALQNRIALPAAVRSVDSAAWHGTVRGNAWQNQGYTKRQWQWHVGWPAYCAKLEAAQSSPKQLELSL